MKKIVVSLLCLIVVGTWSFVLIASTIVDNMGSYATLPIKNRAIAVAKSSPWEQRLEASEVSTRQNFLLATRSTTQNIPKVLGEQTTTVSNLTQEQVIDLVKPGVVSIINWMDGKLTVPDFDIDLKTFVLTPRPDLTAHVLNTDWNVYGSGFVVNANGYIATNAHVVSKDSAYEEMTKDINDHWNDIYGYEQGLLSDKEYSDYQHYLDITYGTGSASDTKINKIIDEEIAKYIKANMLDEATQKIVVIDKSLKGMTLPEKGETEAVFNKGLPADIVDFDQDYKENHKDVALIKIAEKNLPALPLAVDDNLAVGQSTLILGYPYNAQIADGDLFEPTLTQGIVGAVKDLDGQKVIQLDNKISPGSSGGPLINSQGRVIGLVTYETGDLQSGDNFSFALPVQLVKDILAKNNVNNDLGVYGSNLLLGFANQSSSYCKKALDDYNAALGLNSHFVLSGMLSSYINSCQGLITNKLSKDSTWDVIRIFYTEHQVNAVLFTLFALIILGFGVVLLRMLVKHMHQKQMFTGQVPMPPPHNIVAV